MLEIKPAKEMKGTVRLPVSDDLFFLSVVIALATKCPAKVSPCRIGEPAASWGQSFAEHCTFTYENDSCHIEAKAACASPLKLLYDDIPFRDFIVPLLLGMKKTLIIDPLPPNRLALWKKYAAECRCTIQETDSDGQIAMCLAGTENFSVKDTVKSIDMIHPILGFSLGLGKEILIMTEGSMSSPLRNILPAIGYDLTVASNTVHDKNESDLTKRMRFLQVNKKSDGPQLFKVSANFTKRKDTHIAITVPGDDVLGSILIAAKCLVSRGGLVIENVGLESWNTQTLQLVKKMGCIVSTQETGHTTYGAVGTVSLQKFALSGRKVDCKPLFQYASQLPAMITLAAFAQGQSVFRGLEDLHNDMPDGLERLLAFVNVSGMRHGDMPDGIVIDGGRQYDGFDVLEPLPAELGAACVAVALHCLGKTTINDDNIIRRWPRFYELLLSICEFRD